MRRGVLFLIGVLLVFCSSAQKKPLDHSVYDSWQHIGEQLISNNGQWVVYTIDPQDGDNELVIQSYDGKYKKIVPRCYSALITEDSRFVIFKIKPLHKETREAKIKKKRPDDMPKDSLGIVELGKEEVWKTAKVRTYKTPQKGAGWVAYHFEKVPEPVPKRTQDPALKKVTDSLTRIIDSLQRLLEESQTRRKNKNEDSERNDAQVSIAKELDHAIDQIQIAYSLNANDNYDADGDENPAAPVDTGSDLVLRNLITGEEKLFNNVLEYYFSKPGNRLLLELARIPKDTNSRATVMLYDLDQKKLFRLSTSGSDFRNFAFTDDGSQLAYLAERDARHKDLQKFYKIWYYKNGMDSASLLADKHTVDMKIGMTISEHGNLNFSKSGKRLFFGVAPIQPSRDTSIIEIDKAKLDIWHYNDDYLQTVQSVPNRLRAAQQENYLAVYDFSKRQILQLGSREVPQVIQTNEGDGDMFIGVTDFGKRIESQWRGSTLKDIYAIDLDSGSKKLVKDNLHGQVYSSTTGKYILWYDRKAKHYFVWDGEKVKNISEKIKVPLWNEDSQVPDEPGNYGVMGWKSDDQQLFIYDKFDIWALDPRGIVDPVSPTKGLGRKSHTSYRYTQLDPDKRYFERNDTVLLRSNNNQTKSHHFTAFEFSSTGTSLIQLKGNIPDSHSISSVRGKNFNKVIFTIENFKNPPDIYYGQLVPFYNRPPSISSAGVGLKLKKLSSINLQQQNYLWGDAELFKWKAYNGKEATGIVYKPEDFDPKKKYPMIVYFYEKLSEALHDYKEPAPIRSVINIPFFVSRGYILFLPDIHYTTGQPGKDAYDYIVSGTRALIRKGWVDSANMALQGHSWGGYQAAQLATMTKLYKAVWAGAPVANMTSAYGGIRWESGLSRQFQYEKTQSRIGATLWEKPELYIKNSPLFHLDKVTAPIVIMHNDADGAVPWYQGIELFTGLRRLGKKVWMFNYNGQGHGLTQRQDMIDYQIRMQQFFDWILKGEKPARWIVEGLPAVKKGKEWGLEIIQ